MPRKRRISRETISDDPDMARQASRKETYWYQAAAFGDGPADNSGYVCVRYMDAMRALCQPSAKDGRYRYKRGDCGDDFFQDIDDSAAYRAQ